MRKHNSFALQINNYNLIGVASKGMDPKTFFNLGIRQRYVRDQIETISPTLQYVCSVIEKHKKTDQRKSGRYNLIQPIDSIDKLSLENVKMEELSPDLLQSYEYEQLPQFTKIMHLNRVDQELFDF